MTREEAIKIINCYDINFYDLSGGKIPAGKLAEAFDMAIEALKDRPHGEWQRVDEQPYFRKHYHKVCCSVCHKQGSEKYNYCPNCGADMRGEKNG